MLGSANIIQASTPPHLPTIAMLVTTSHRISYRHVIISRLHSTLHSSPCHPYRHYVSSLSSLRVSYCRHTIRGLPFTTVYQSITPPPILNDPQRLYPAKSRLHILPSSHAVLGSANVIHDTIPPRLPTISYAQRRTTSHRILLSPCHLKSSYVGCIPSYIRRHVILSCHHKSS
jgi:hypothetical protein